MPWTGGSDKEQPGYTTMIATTMIDLILVGIIIFYFS